MSVILGNPTKYSGIYTDGYYWTEHAIAISVPGPGYIRRLGGWLADYPDSGDYTGALTTKFVIYDGAGNVLAVTPTFPVDWWDSEGYLYQYEQDLSSPLWCPAAGTYYIGPYHVASGTMDIRFGIASGGSFRAKLAGNGGPVALTGTTDPAYKANFYAYFDPVSAPNKPTTTSYGVVTSTTPSVSVHVTTPDASAIDTVKITVTGTTPAHGPVEVTATGGPWASGSDVAVTCDNAHLGWTPAAGDKLTYHGIAANSGGTTTGDESSELWINSTSAPTITDPASGPVIAHPYLSGALIGATVAWAFNDPQGEAQSAYQVKLYADSGGSLGALLPGADSGKVSSVGARSASVTPTAGLTNKAYFWVGIRTWDVHDAVSTEATVRTRMAWGRSDGRTDLGATPVQWSIAHVSVTAPANTQVVMQYSGTPGATYPPSTWYSDIGLVPFSRYFHWRCWLFGWGSLTPTTPSLDELAIGYTSSARVTPDDWSFSDSCVTLCLDTWKLGRKSVKVTCNGTPATHVAFATVPVKPYTNYMIQAAIRVQRTSGIFAAYCELWDGTNSLVKTSQLSTTTSDFTNVHSVNDANGHPTVYQTGAQTSLTFRCVVVEGAGCGATEMVWFDCVEASDGSVVPVWSPGLMDAIDIDRQGLQVDASRGALLRLVGSSGGAFDAVDLYQHGLRFGGGPEISSPDGVNLRATDGSLVPPGSVLGYGAASAPTGWLLCNGAAISRTTYAALFAVIGSTFGNGDGSTTFNVPNLQQRFPLGKAASGTGSTLGGTGGAIDPTHTHTLGGHVHSTPSHQHALGFEASGGHIFVKETPGAYGTRSTSNVPTKYYNYYSNPGGTLVEQLSSSDNGGNTGGPSGGSDSAASGNPPFLVLNYIVKT